MQEFKKLGFHFTFKATGGRDGWWAKTDITLPKEEEMESAPLPVQTKTDHPGKVTGSTVANPEKIPSPEAKSNGSEIPESGEKPEEEGKHVTGSETKAVAEIIPVPYTFAIL